jgi:hypothetical protein
MNPAPAAAARRPGPGLSLLLAVALLAHAVQLFSLLRLNHDAVRLLGMAWSAHSTGSYDVRGIADQYPPGYPTMVRMLQAAGLGRTFWLNLLGFVWLAVTATAQFWTARRLFGLSRERALVAALLPLLSWVTVKHVAMPLSDIPYLGLAALSLLCLQTSWLAGTRAAGPAWGAALLLALAAVQVRTIGITLVGTVLLAAIFHPQVRPRFGVWAAWPRWVLGLGALAVGCLGVALFAGLTHTDWFARQFVMPGSYFAHMRARLTDASGMPWPELANHRLQEIFSVAFNLPFRGLPPLLYVPGALLAIAGLLWLALRFRGSHLPLVLYLILTAAVVAVWPYLDARFLLPLLPPASLLIVSGVPAFTSARSRRQVFLLACLGAYALAGLAALGYSIRQTLSGRELARNYSSGPYQLTYRYAFGYAPGTSPAGMDANCLAVLREYEPRVEPAPSGP